MEKCEFYEQIMKVMYDSYIPSYSISYNCLGDAETLTLKYTFELAIYFGFFVLPFVNRLFTDHLFMRTYMRKFALFGPINKGLQMFLHDFFDWKKANGTTMREEPVHIDFYDQEPLRMSEKLFYEVGLTREEAEDVLEMHVERMKDFARYIIAHVYAVVLGDKRVLLNAPFVSSIKLRDTSFDPARMREHYARFADSDQIYQWKLNPFALDEFIPEKPMMADPVSQGAALEEPTLDR